MKTLPIFCIRKPRNQIWILSVFVCLSTVLSLTVGSVSISPLKAFMALAGHLPGSIEEHILLYSRLPRTLGCLFAGGALAVSGVVIQRVLHNPLAAPNIIGVNSGAGFMVALCCAMAPTAFWLIPLASFVGALAGAILVFWVARRAGASRITLVLTGIAISGIFSAGIDAVVTCFPDALNGYSDFRIGGFSNLTLDRILPAFWVILIAFIGTLLLSGEMDVLALGDETSRSLGLATERIRILLLTCAAALAGAAVSIAGLLGFVGLVVPHIMRRMVGEESTLLIISSILGGAAFVTLCDLAARMLFSPYILPVGIILSLVGGGFFLWLLIKGKGGRYG